MALRRSAPQPMYQGIIVNLMTLLHTHVKAHGLGKVCVAPTDVFLSLTTVIQLDILFIRQENIGIITELNIQGPPDLCIEVLSPSMESVDRERKMTVYARCGVPEYWIIDPARETVSVFEIDGDTYWLRSEATGDNVMARGVLTGFAITARSIFA